MARHSHHSTAKMRAPALNSRSRPPVIVPAHRPWTVWGIELIKEV